MKPTGLWPCQESSRAGERSACYRYHLGGLGSVGPTWPFVVAYCDVSGDGPLWALPTDASLASQTILGVFIWLSRGSGRTLGISPLWTQEEGVDRLAAWFYF